jgi:myo-inositol-1(or 4)-monophosphatase
MVFGTGLPFIGKGDHGRTLRELRHIMPEVAGIRRCGAAALDLAWTAAGRLDGFWERDLNSWDIAAGILMVREAGGFVSPTSGGKTRCWTAATSSSATRPPTSASLRAAVKRGLTKS